LYTVNDHLRNSLMFNKGMMPLKRFYLTNLTYQQQIETLILTKFLIFMKLL